MVTLEFAAGRSRLRHIYVFHSEMFAGPLLSKRRCDFRLCMFVLDVCPVCIEVNAFLAPSLLLLSHPPHLSGMSANLVIRHTDHSGGHENPVGRFVSIFFPNLHF
jgi:hypothetical protein